MANRWNIPNWLELKVRARDKACVYCQNLLTTHQVCRKRSASWEHIINDAAIITAENIALCCCGCNASKGQKPLSAWLNSNYCLTHGISAETVAPVVKSALAFANEAKS